jgi:hypothetical protein
MTNEDSQDKNLINEYHLRNIQRRSILRTSDSSTTSTESGSFNKPREVSFDSISIRNYSMELGNHPNCQVGAPVTLSWDFEEEGIQDIDVYEFERKPRRTTRHLILNYYRRKDILKLAGYSDKELKAAEKAVAQVQRQRQATATFWPVRKLGELVGSAARKVTRVGRRNSSPE